MKTREKLIDVARQLFARKGMEHTTISDIAEAAEKGRRTIYTYFKDKVDIYNAVLAEDADKIVETLEEIVSNPSLSSEEKLRLFIIEQFRIHKKGNGWEGLRNLLKLDMGRLEKMRKLALEREERLLERLLDEGIQRGEFRADRAMDVRRFLVQVILAMGVSVDSHKGDAQLLGAVEGLADFVSEHMGRD
ncbi:MAG: TetR/AcrR family transcriptional regulator [Muribaculaceae bacterium]|nr:TetR/AcrR family transcriptional regulator [Muribaculaceae bacterium]